MAGCCRGQQTAGAVTGLLAGMAILGPSLAPGFLLRYDMVFVPALRVTDQRLGIDGAVPRAMPNDLVVAWLSALLPGAWVQKLLLLGCLVLVGAGVGRLLPTRAGAVAAALAATWNPWVGERIGIGHWGYLIGYALLPWAAWAAARTTSAKRWWLPLGGVLVGGAAGGSTSALLVSGTVLMTLLVAGGRSVSWGRVLAVIGFSTLVNACWWWPSLSARVVADPAAVQAFAAGADTPFGVFGSVLLGGGIWNDRQWFVERQQALPALLALLIVVLVWSSAARDHFGRRARAANGDNDQWRAAGGCRPPVSWE